LFLGKKKTDPDYVIVSEEPKIEDPMSPEVAQDPEVDEEEEIGQEQLDPEDAEWDEAFSDVEQVILLVYKPIFH